MDLIKPKWKDVKTILLWKINIKEHTFSLSRKKESNNSMQQPFQIITKKKYTSLRFFFQYWMVLNWGRLLVMVGSPVYPRAKHSVLLSSYLTVLVQSNPSYHPYKIIFHQKNILQHGLSCSQSSKEEEICEYILNVVLLPQDFLYVFKNKRLVKIHSHKNRLLFILVFLMMILRSVRIRSRS